MISPARSRSAPRSDATVPVVRTSPPVPDAGSDGATASPPETPTDTTVDPPVGGAGDPPTDADLVARIGTGDPRALDALYGRYGRPAFSLAARICGDRGMAEDVVQEVFLALWRDHERFDGRRGTLGSWLMTVVHHKAVDAVRREVTRRRHHPLAESPEDAAATTPAHAADRQALGAVIGDQVRAALGRLPREQRETLGLAYYGGYTQREVAVLTGVPVGTVKSRMFAGVARLRVLLGPLLGAGAADVLGDMA